MVLTGDDGVSHSLLLFLQLENLFFHAVFTDHFIGEDLSGLPDPVCPVCGLILNSRVPPWIVMDDVIRSCQIQAGPPSFQGDEEDGNIRIIVESVYLVKTVLAGPVQVSKGHFVHNQPGADDVQHLDKLGKDQDLVSVFNDPGDQILEGLELA